MIDADSDVVSFAVIILSLNSKSRKPEQSHQYYFYIHFLPNFFIAHNYLHKAECATNLTKRTESHKFAYKDKLHLYVAHPYFSIILPNFAVYSHPYFIIYRQ